MNAKFWIGLDKLRASTEIVIDRPKFSAHPKYPEFIYPLDYGYLRGTCSGDGNEIDVWQGSMQDDRLVGIACTVDLKKKDTELKLLIGCMKSETEDIQKFYDSNPYMSGLIITRDVF